MIKRIISGTSESEAVTDEPDDIQAVSQTKPAFYVPLKNQEGYEGEDMIMECVIVANPEPEVIWYRNSVPIKESNNIQLLFHGDSCKLVLKHIHKDLSGEFKVRAINGLGECQSTACLKVNPPKRSSQTLDSGTQTTEASIVETHLTSHSYIHSIANDQG